MNNQVQLAQPEAVTSSNPFRGLVPFNEGETLFERDADVELLLSRFGSGRMILLFAGSGVGKSSFLNALFIPALKQMLGTENVKVLREWAQDEPVSTIQLARKQITLAKPRPKTSIIILDQFEEIFQYFPHPSLLQQIGTQLSRISEGQAWRIDEDDISFSDKETQGDEYVEPVDIRLLISVREEFLAEMSMFDDFVAGLFTNYYRLGATTVEQGRSIIIQTAGSRVTVDNLRMEELLKDLANVKSGNSRVGESTIIPLPYLQIVCARLWERENPVGGTPFLTSYIKGQAEQELEGYCRKTLDSLSIREKILAGRALGQLTTAHEAKRSVRLSDLADELGASPERLDRILSKLSSPSVKILRKITERNLKPTDDSDRPEVYQLYHDMYAPLLSRWRREQERLEVKVRLSRALVAALVLWFLIGDPLVQWWGVRKTLDRAQGTSDEIADLREMRNAFSRSILFRGIGNKVWREYNSRFATERAMEGDTDGALLYRIATLAVDDKQLSDKVMFGILGPAKYLLATLRQSGRIYTDAVIVREKASTRVPIEDIKDQPKSYILAGTQDGKIFRWTDGSANPEDVSAIFTQKLQQNEARRVLCFSPDGLAALIAKATVPSTDSESQRVALTLTIVSTQDGSLKAQLTPSESLRLSLIVADSNVPEASQGRPFDARQIALQNLAGIYNPHGSRIGVVAGNDLGRKAIIFDGQLKSLGEVNTGNRYISDISFSECGSNKCGSTTVAVITLDSPNAVQSHSKIGLWTDDKQRVTEIPGTPWLPLRAKLVFRRDGKFLAKLGTQEDEWAWISGAGEAPETLILPKDVLPQGFVSVEDRILMSKDGSGRLFLTDLRSLSPNGEVRSTELSVSEPSTPSSLFVGEARVTTYASVHGAGEYGQFLTIDSGGLALRQWEVPPFESWVTLVPGRVNSQGESASLRGQNPNSHSSPNSPIFYSYDDKWKAIPEGQLLIVQSNSADNLSADKWTVKLPLRRDLQSVTVGASGNRLLLWYSDIIVYIDKNDASASGSHIARENVNDIVLGPGSNRITVVTTARIYLYNPSSRLADQGDSRLPRVEWEHLCVRCSLLHDADERAVVFYSGVWVHRMTKTGTREWPQITSVLAPVNLSPLTALNLLDIHDNNKVGISGTNAKPIDFEAEEKAFANSHLSSPTLDFGVWKLDLCKAGDPEKHVSGHSAEHNVICEWETRSGRQLGDLREIK